MSIHLSIPPTRRALQYFAPRLTFSHTLKQAARLQQVRACRVDKSMPCISHWQQGLLRSRLEQAARLQQVGACQVDLCVQHVRHQLASHVALSIHTAKAQHAQLIDGEWCMYKQCHQRMTRNTTSHMPHAGVYALTAQVKSCTWQAGMLVQRGARSQHSVIDTPLMDTQHTCVMMAGVEGSACPTNMTVGTLFTPI